MSRHITNIKLHPHFMVPQMHHSSQKKKHGSWGVFSILVYILGGRSSSPHFLSPFPFLMMVQPYIGGFLTWGYTPKSSLIGSMYAIYGNIYHQYTPNVGIYAIHTDPMGYKPTSDWLGIPLWRAGWKSRALEHDVARSIISGVAVSAGSAVALRGHLLSLGLSGTVGERLKPWAAAVGWVCKSYTMGCGSTKQRVPLEVANLFRGKMGINPWIWGYHSLRKMQVFHNTTKHHMIETKHCWKAHRS